MDERERLIEVLRGVKEGDDVKFVADYLLKNDVGPVVRCSQCKYCVCDNQFDEKFVCARFSTQNNHIEILSKDDFCSYGERSDT